MLQERKEGGSGSGRLKKEQDGGSPVLIGVIGAGCQKPWPPPNTLQDPVCRLPHITAGDPWRKGWELVTFGQTGSPGIKGASHLPPGGLAVGRLPLLLESYRDMEDEFCPECLA